MCPQHAHCPAGSPAQPRRAPPSCPCSFPPGWSRSCSCKPPPHPQGLTKCFWTKPKMEPLAGWFPGQLLESAFLVPSRAEHIPLFWETRPFWAQPPGQDPPSHCVPPLPAAQPGGRGRGRTLPGDRQCLTSQQARGRKEQSWREGKGRRGHLSSFSVPQE